MGVPAWKASFKTETQHPIHLIPYSGKSHPRMIQELILGLSKKSDTILNPCFGSGTALIEAARLKRQVIGYDESHMAFLYTAARLRIPNPEEVDFQLEKIKKIRTKSSENRLPEFFHDKTWEDIQKVMQNTRKLDPVSLWIRMICITLTTGNTPWAFAYTSEPAFQEPSYEEQTKWNSITGKSPEEKDVIRLIREKSWQLTGTPLNFQQIPKIKRSDALKKQDILPESINLLLCAPPSGKDISLNNQVRHNIAQWDIKPRTTYVEKFTEKLIRNHFEHLKTEGHMVFILRYADQRKTIEFIKDTGMHPIGIINQSLILRKVAGEKPKTKSQDIAQDIPPPYSQEFFEILENMLPSEKENVHQLLDWLILNRDPWEVMPQIRESHLGEDIAHAINTCRDTKKHHATVILLKSTLAPKTWDMIKNYREILKEVTYLTNPGKHLQEIFKEQSHETIKKNPTYSDIMGRSK